MIRRVPIRWIPNGLRRQCALVHSFSVRRLPRAISNPVSRSESCRNTRTMETMLRCRRNTSSHELDRVLAQAGTSLANAVEKQLYEPDLLTFHDVDKVGIRYMPTPPPRASMGVKGLIVPGASFVANLTVLVPDKDHVKEGSKKGVNWHPSKKVNFTPTIKAGQWRFFAGNFSSPDFMTVEAAPAGLPHHTSDIEVQTRCTMELLREQIEANESDWAHCHHIRVFLLNMKRDYRGFIRVWREYFPTPDKAPALCVVPATAVMYPGPIIEIDPTCIAR